MCEQLNHAAAIPGGQLTGDAGCTAAGKHGDGGVRCPFGRCRGLPRAVQEQIDPK